MSIDLGISLGLIFFASLVLSKVIFELVTEMFSDKNNK